jgi:hypothetical protein
MLLREELAFLADQLQKFKLIGFDEGYLKNTHLDAGKVKGSLAEKGFISIKGDSISIEPNLLNQLTVLLDPHKAMIVIRELPEIGKQKVVFLITKGRIIMHLQPEENQHGIKEIAPLKLLPALLDWFKLAAVKQANLAPIKISADELENFRIAIENGKGSAAARLLPATANDASKQALLDSYLNRTISGALTSFDCSGDEALDLTSFSVVAGPAAAWMITLHPGDENSMLVKTAGEDLSLYLASFVERFTGQISSEFQSFILSIETLAYSLALINRPDIGQKMLTEKYPELTSEKLKEIYEKAFAVMSDAGLCTKTNRGQVSLDPRLEKAVFPLAKFDGIIQTAIIRPELQSEARINYQTNGYFTSVIQVENKYVVEFGATSSLAMYLFTVYAGFGMNKSAPLTKESAIHLATLIKLVEGSSTPEGMRVIVKDQPLSEATKSQLIEDVANQEFRATVQKLAPTARKEKSPTRPTLLLLQGRVRSWLFDFLDTANDPLGKVSLVSRDDFLASLDRFVKQ